MHLVPFFAQLHAGGNRTRRNVLAFTSGLYRGPVARAATGQTPVVQRSSSLLSKTSITLDHTQASIPWGWEKSCRTLSGEITFAINAVHSAIQKWNVNGKKVELVVLLHKG